MPTIYAQTDEREESHKKGLQIDVSLLLSIFKVSHAYMA